MNKEIAKAALDKIIAKARVHLYKPIQIAEILYYDRTNPGKIDLMNKSEYINRSKKWRDDITIELVGSKSTSSAQFQNNLFDDNAIPPEVLVELAKENKLTNGAVEAYIYGQFINRYLQLSAALDYALNTSKDDFDVKKFIDSFRHEPGLKRSIDKIYEIIVYSLFSTLVSVLDLQVTVSINEEKHDLLTEFIDFTQLVMSLDMENITRVQNARVYRVGVTNAADRGLDMYSNWGPAIQIKHISLSEEVAEDVVQSVASDKIVIVCKDAEERVIHSLLNQLGWHNRIQSIITESHLITWYEKALRGTYASDIGDELLTCLCEEIFNEFPSVDGIPDVLKKRNYNKINDDFWK